jgi:Bacterial Ig-like domain (group 3)
MKSRIRQLLTSCAVAAVTSAIVVGGVDVAQAATPGPLLGSLALSQPTGMDSTTLIVTSSGVCDDSTPNLRVVLTGNGFPTDGQVVVGNSPTANYTINNGGYYVPLQNTLQAFAAEQSPPVSFNGAYELTLFCQDRFDQLESGSYDVSIYFTDPTHWQSTPPVTATSTTLTATPASPVSAGTSVTLTATVAPSGATGTVQFLDGGAALGSPVAVASNVAKLTTTALTAAAHTLTATFSPSAPAGATASTSAALAYTVNPAVPAVPVATSAAALVLPVGTFVTCPNGSRLPVPASALGSVVHCNSGPDIVVSRGIASHALVAPSLSGTGKVGSKLTLEPGLWTPAYATRTVVWKRDGKAIAKQNGPTYVVKKTDKGHHISVTVTAHLPGHFDGTASTGSLGAKAAAVVATVPVPQAVSGDATPIGVPVGSVIGCVKGAFSGATGVTTGWLLDGKPYDAPIALIIPDSLAGHQLVCQTTATNAGGSTSSQAVVKVVAGPALLSYLKPTISGVAKAGKKLTAAAGKWYPVYAKAAFVWLRDGKVITGATKATYVVKATDKKHHLAVRVTVTRTGWGSSKATSTAVSVG